MPSSRSNNCCDVHRRISVVSRSTWMAWSSHAIMAGWAPSHGARPDVAVLCECIVVGQRDEMKERGIRHTTSECTLRGFTSAQAKVDRSEEHTSELQSLAYLVCRLLLEKKKKTRLQGECWTQMAAFSARTPGTTYPLQR